jgi:hypothetical protein
MTPEGIGARKLASVRPFFGFLQLARARTYPNTEMCQAVINACPGYYERPNAVANAAVEVLLSKCGVADLGVGIGIGIGHEVRAAIITVIIFSARHRLGCDLRGIHQPEHR